MPKSISYDLFIVGESIDIMQKGALVIKLRSSSKKYPRKFFLDQQSLNIRWTPSKKGDRAKSKSNFQFNVNLTQIYATVKQDVVSVSLNLDFFFHLSVIKIKAKTNLLELAYEEIF